MIYMTYVIFTEISHITLGSSWLFWTTMHIWTGLKLKIKMVIICTQGNIVSRLKNVIQHQP